MESTLAKELVEQLQLLNKLSSEVKDSGFKYKDITTYKKKYTDVLKGLSKLIPQLKLKSLSEQAKEFLIVNVRLKSIQKFVGFLTVLIIIFFAIMFQLYIIEEKTWMYVITVLSVIVIFLVYRKIEKEIKLLSQDITTVENVTSLIIKQLKTYSK